MFDSIHMMRLLHWGIRQVTARRRTQEVIRFYLLEYENMQELEDASRPGLHQLLGEDRFPACLERLTRQLQSYEDPGQVFSAVMRSLDWEYFIQGNEADTRPARLCRELSKNRGEKWYYVGMSFAHEKAAPPENSEHHMAEFRRYSLWCGVNFDIDESVRAFNLFKQHLRALQWGEVLVIRHEFCEPSPSSSSTRADERRSDQPSQSGRRGG